MLLYLRICSMKVARKCEDMWSPGVSRLHWIALPSSNALALLRPSETPLRGRKSIRTVRKAQLSDKSSEFYVSDLASCGHVSAMHLRPREQYQRCTLITCSQAAEVKGFALNDLLEKWAAHSFIASKSKHSKWIQNEMTWNEGLHFCERSTSPSHP